MPKTALVIGGTGPTGPFVVEGLADRGYDVTILHGGQHEVEFRVPGIKHIHEDPHFEETLLRGIGDQTFDLVVAQYGRLRVIAGVFAGRTERLIGVGGTVYAPVDDERWGGLGRPELFPEGTPYYPLDEGPNAYTKLRYRMRQATEALFEEHNRGSYSATYLGFAVNYGPRNPGPYDWTIIRRVLDGRKRLIIADGGMKLEARVFSPNAAHAVLMIVDKPEIAAGKHYTVGDRYVYSMRQRIEFIAKHMGHEFELVDMPYEVAWPCHPYWRTIRGHVVSGNNLIREELGYRELVEPDEGFRQTIDWLVANAPAPGSELERQVGDPFDYAAEDQLIALWRGARASMGEIVSKLPEAGHQYRHPKAPGEAWKPGPNRTM